MNTFRDVIDVFGGVLGFAGALSLKKNHAGNMYLRDSINGKYFDDIVVKAQNIGREDVTHELLCKLAARRNSQKPEVDNGE